MAIFSISTIKRCHPAFGEDAGRADAFDIESFVQSELAAPAFSEDADVADAVGHICILTKIILVKSGAMKPPKNTHTGLVRINSQPTSYQRVTTPLEYRPAQNNRLPESVAVP